MKSETMKYPLYKAMSGATKPGNSSALAMGLVAMGGALALSACAAVTPEVDGYAEGWRRARVEALANGAEAPGATPGALRGPVLHMDCHAQTVAGHTPTPRHALVSYAYGGNPNLRRYILAPLPTDLSPQPGEQVAVQVRQCEALRALIR
jgi:hypothetical protein